MKYSSHWKQISVNLCFSVVAIQPFWKTKPEVYRKIVEERAVIVSAQSSPKIKLNGGGIVDAPSNFAFEEIQKYDKLDESLDIIKNVEWHKNSSEIDLDVSMLGLNTHLLVAVTPSTVDEKPLFLKFEIKKGWMRGLQGKLELASLENNKTEVGFMAEFPEKEENYFSRVFSSLTLEGIMKRTAQSLRAHVESEWKKHEGKP